MTQDEKNLFASGAGSRDFDTQNSLEKSSLSLGEGSFFDPPIEQYRNIYGSTRQPQSRARETGTSSNNFFKMKREKHAT